jgi:hypothetical protein
MRLQVFFKIALVLIFVAGAPGADPPSSSGEPVTAKTVRRAEKEARSADDHRRLTAYYEYEARAKQAELTEQEQLVNSWGQTSMATRTKIPNPYWNAQALARLYREQLKTLTKRAAEHRRAAESIDAGAGPGPPGKFY